MEAIIFSAFALLESGWPIYSQFLAPVLGYGPSASQSSYANPALRTGSPGAQGMSAYDLWVALGNAGSVQDFLNALIGEPGEDGEDGQIIYRGSTRIVHELNSLKLVGTQLIIQLCLRVRTGICKQQRFGLLKVELISKTQRIELHLLTMHKLL